MAANKYSGADALKRLWDRISGHIVAINNRLDDIPAPYDDSELKAAIAQKVGYSEVVGNQLIMYADATKSKLLATMDLPKTEPTDVQVNGESIVSDGVAPIPIANENAKLGLMRGSQTYGFNMDMYSYMRGLGFTAAEFANADNRAFICKSTLNNVLNAMPKIVWCEYGTTTYDEVSAMVANGYIPAVKAVNCYGVLTTYLYANTSGSHIFYASNGENSFFLVQLNKNNAWSDGLRTLQLISYRVSNISSDSTNTQYPSAKAVYNYAEPKQKDFVLIDDFTPQSDTADFEKRVCPDGTPYAFDEVIIVAYRPTGISHSTYNAITMWDKNGNRCRNELGRITDESMSERMAILYLEKHGNLAISNRWTFALGNDNPVQAVQVGSNPLIDGTTSNDRSFAVGFSTILTIVFDKVYAGQRYVIYAR